MLVAILIVLSLIFWTGYVVIYFWEGIYGWFDNRWGPKHRPVKVKRQKRRLYE